MSDLVFVDSNVFAYARDILEPDEQRPANAWLVVLWQERRGRISTQVLQELYNTLTRKLRRPVSVDAARSYARRLYAWNPVVLDSTVLDTAFLIEERYQLSWWDSLIVAAAQRTECRYLLSEDFQAGQDFDGVTVVDPFVTAPAEVA